MSEERGKKLGQDLNLVQSREDEIAEIEKQIFELEQRKKKLQKELIESKDSFEEKFFAWWESDEGETSDYIPRESQYPALRRYIRTQEDLNRYQTYDLSDFFGDEFYNAFSPEVSEQERIAYFTPSGYHKPPTIEEVTEIAREIMKGNIKGFTCDW